MGATCRGGCFATVHGAVETGYREANAILMKVASEAKLSAWNWSPSSWDVPHSQASFVVPSRSADFRIALVPGKGLGVIAHRRFAKGECITSLSDRWLDPPYMVHKGDTVQRMLMDTNGEPLRVDPVPIYEFASPCAENVWVIEPIKHLCNHSCNPNLTDEKDGDHEFQGFELFKTYAARDIEAGEELCYDYCLEYYDKGPFFSPCLCRRLQLSWFGQWLCWLDARAAN